MVTGVVAACAVLAAFGLALHAVRRSRQESERRLELVLERLGAHLDAISAGVERSVERVVQAQNERLPPLTLDFDALCDEIAREASARTGADAVILRVEGPGGRPVIASTGAAVDAALVDRTLTPSDAGAFRAATIDWTYSPAGDPEDEQFHSALVAPLGTSAAIPGTLVAYSRAPHAFRPEHTAAVHQLLADVATALGNARRFADVEARLLLDPETGIASRRGYELQLGREVARAGRTGRPFSVVLVGLDGGSENTTTENGQGVDRFARRLTQLTRRGDISCRRGERQFAILLPETRASGAAVLTSRLREEARRSLGSANVTVGHVEWQPDESAEALDARVDAALTPVGVRRLGVAGTTEQSPMVEAHLSETTEALRRDALETVAHEILEGRPYGRSLAVVAVRIEDSFGHVAARLAESVGSGSVLRLGTSELVLVLPGATADDAEALLGSLHAEMLLSAGITEVVERDGAETALARAEHALWQATQTGRGTVVVAVPGRRRPGPDS